MKPLRIFIFFAAVALLLFLLALIIPRQGISITPDLQLKFMNLSDLSARDTVDSMPASGSRLPTAHLVRWYTAPMQKGSLR